MMGYTHASSIGYYGNVVSGNFIMDNVECVGDELDILSYPHVSVDNCGPTEGAKVFCASTTLSDGKNSFQYIAMKIMVPKIFRKHLCNPHVL